MKVTSRDIEYSCAPYGGIAVIPKGTAVTPAENLSLHPHAGYWAEPWGSMTETEENWHRNYGFYVLPWEVEEIS